MSQVGVVSHVNTVNPVNMQDSSLLPVFGMWLHTSRSSSLVGVFVSERLSSTAFLNSADWATMVTVSLGF
jgi:hypothetical protein